MLKKKVPSSDIDYIKFYNCCPNSDTKPLIFSDAQEKMGDCSTAMTGVYIGVIVAVIFMVILGCFIYHARVWLYSKVQHVVSNHFQPYQQISY